MATPQQERPSSRRISIPCSQSLLESSTTPFSGTPSAALRTPLTDHSISKRLKDAGLDEESVKRRDKAALIAYIAKLEAEIFDYQHNMGLLILERKDWDSKYEQVKATAESAEIIHKRDQTAHASALAEAKMREDKLKKALGVEKVCVANLEKALHEMRAEAAEAKVAAESSLAEARNMAEGAQVKFAEAEAKLRAAESLEADANRYHRAAERKLHEVEAREDDLRRRIISFKSDCEAKEKEMLLERESLHERQKILQQGQERLLDNQTSLNQRENYFAKRYEDLTQLEKELDSARANIEEHHKSLCEEKMNLEMKRASLLTSEEAVIDKEARVHKREQELLFLQEKVASLESEQQKKVMANQETVLKLKMSEFEAEIEKKRKLVEDEIDTKRRTWELREVDLKHREDFISEREHELEVQSATLFDKEKDVTEKWNLLNEKEKHIDAAEKEIEANRVLLMKEKEDVSGLKQDLQKSLELLELRKREVDCAGEKVEALKNETSELLILETKLKEEIDLVRAQKLELMAEAEKLKAEKAKFETEWELVDEKKEELCREAEYIAKERLAVSEFLKDERESLKQEKDALRAQYKLDSDSLAGEREEFMNKMRHEHVEWFNKMQQERADVLLDIEMQKKELENCLEKRREEIESSLREKERAFEQEKMRELDHISSLKEKLTKEQEHVALEMKKLEMGRTEINVDRERRDKEWSELNNLIEELQMQREKLKEQRELLHADREKILVQIEYLKKLEDLKYGIDEISELEQQSKVISRRKEILAKSFLKQQSALHNAILDSHEKLKVSNGGLKLGLPSQVGGNNTSPSSTPFSFFKRCTKFIFKPSPNLPIDLEQNYPQSCDKKANSRPDGIQHSDYAQEIAEPKVILEVPTMNDDANDGIPVHSISKSDEQSGRKRRHKASSSNSDYNLLAQGVSYKKRRQQKDATGIASEDIALNCVLSTEEDVPEDPESVKLVDETLGTYEGNNNAVDIDAEILETTCEATVVDSLALHHEVKCQQNLVSEFGEEILEVGGSNGHPDSQRVGNGLTSSTSSVQKKQADALPVDGGLIDSQNQENDKKCGEYEVPDSEPENSIKVSEELGRRTRSKRKL
ncbi:hypothetical protein RJ641_011489 [Dillenia turbinata]|uniref:Uncharacterized protein n=1 Tax=Dillenia turbinata TaxID=194707 RepID=A0AAN8UWA3_9MAGN